MLIHREFMNGFPAKFVIERGRVMTENSNRPHGHGSINPASFAPYPKNPVIARFFKETGMADELGSGVRKLFRYCNVYGGADPQMVEGDVFRTFVQVPDEPRAVTPEAELESRPESRLESEIVKAVLQALAKQPLGSVEIARLLGHKGVSGTIKLTIRLLRAKELIEYTLPAKPKSRLQKYRLTRAGRDFLAGRRS